MKARPKVEDITQQLEGLVTSDWGVIEDIHISDMFEVIVSVCVDPSRGPELEAKRQLMESAISKISGVIKSTVILTAQTPAATGMQSPSKRPAPMQIPGLLPGVKHIVAVASGKGGVGKSTVSSNLAIALAKNGQKIGLLDADIYGPSQPRMMGLEGMKPGGTEGKIDPLMAHGVKVMSIGFMVDSEAPLIWRGPMVQSALVQLMRDVDWGELDILLVDMPPGTGDAQLTMAQKVPLSGAVIVSTPQDIALLDARKGIEMFRKVNVPILGMIENMSTHICSKCGHEDHIFGHGGARLEAERLGVPFLGEVPLLREIREKSDAGEPAYQLYFREIALRLVDVFVEKSPG